MPGFMLLCVLLPGCEQATPDSPGDAPVPQQASPVSPPSSEPVAGGDEQAHAGEGPDQDAIERPANVWHGNWRVVAADDPHDQALMAISIQSSVGEADGTGDYVFFQPFCDALANRPINGGADCELIGLGGTFDRVDASTARLVLTFHPTADGMEHRLDLHREGDRLVGDYIFAANDIRRPVIADRSPDP